MFEILWQTLKLRKWSLLVYCVANVLFLWMYVAMYPSIQQQAQSFSELFERYPDGFLQAFGVEDVSIQTIERFLALEQYSFVWPLMIMFLLLGFAGSMIAGEIEKGTIEILLAKPVSRFRVYLEKYLSGAVLMMVFTVVSVFAVFPFVELYHVEYIGRNYWTLLWISLLFAWTILSVGFMVSSFVSEKSRAFLYTGGLFLVMYVLRVLSGFVERFDWLKYTSVFHYADFTSAIVDNHISGLSIIVFSIVSLVCTAIGVLRFYKRDIAS